MLTVAGVAAALAGVNALARVGAGPNPEWLVPRYHQVQAGVARALGERIAGVSIELARTPAGERDPLGVVFGFSTAREGLDPSVLEAFDGSPRRWLNMATTRGDMSQLTEQTNLFLDSGLPVEIVVLGIHAQHLLRRPHTPIATRSLASMAPSLRRAGLEPLLDSLSSAWCYRLRGETNATFHRILLRLRRSLLSGIDFPVLFAADPSPWDVTLLGYPLHCSAEHLAKQIRGWETLGWFDSTSYEGLAEQMHMLLEIARRFRQRDARVVIVLMPESSTLRRRLPEVAARRFFELLVQSAPDTEPTVVDLRGEIDDEDFADYAHVNHVGRETLSRRVAGELRDGPAGSRD